MNHDTGHGAQFGADVHRGGGLADAVAFVNRYEVECLDLDGNVKWRDIIENRVVNVGLNDILDKYWKGSTYTAAHYVGLLVGAASPINVAAADTMSSHAGWTESTAYSNGARPTLTLGTVASQSVDNSASKASFTINGSATIDGAFITTNSTKGGTTGTLIAGGVFTGGSKVVANGDTLNVTLTLTAATA